MKAFIWGVLRIIIAGLLTVFVVEIFLDGFRMPINWLVAIVVFAFFYVSLLDAEPSEPHSAVTRK